MNQMEAQATISAAIKSDPQAVILKAMAFNPECENAVNDATSVDGPVEGVAAIACRYALRGDDNQATAENMIKFAELLNL